MIQDSTVLANQGKVLRAPASAAARLTVQLTGVQEYTASEVNAQPRTGQRSWLGNASFPRASFPSLPVRRACVHLACLFSPFHPDSHRAAPLVGLPSRKLTHLRRHACGARLRRKSERVRPPRKKTGSLLFAVARFARDGRASGGPPADGKTASRAGRRT